MLNFEEEQLTETRDRLKITDPDWLATYDEQACLSDAEQYRHMLANMPQIPGFQPYALGYRRAKHTPRLTLKTLEILKRDHPCVPTELVPCTCGAALGWRQLTKINHYDLDVEYICTACGTKRSTEMYGV